MAQVTIYKEPGMTVEIFDSAPPVDQTELVASLNALITELNGQIITLTSQLNSALESAASLQMKIDTAKAALA